MPDHVSVDILVRGLDGKVLLQFRDSRCATAPLSWGFWGGAVEDGDPSIEHAAARELGEELCLHALPADFHRVGERVGSNGARAVLCELSHAVTWRQIRVTEGAGAAFLTPAEMTDLRLTRAVRHFLDNRRQILEPPRRGFRNEGPGA